LKFWFTGSKHHACISAYTGVTATKMSLIPVDAICDAIFDELQQTVKLIQGFSSQCQ